MSDDLATRDGRSLDPAKAEANPFRMIPKEYRRPLAFFWSLNQHMLPNALPLAARVRLWIEQQGLTVDELRKVLSQLSDPERSSRHQYAGQLLADLAGAVAVICDQRRRREAAEERRRDEAAARAGAERDRDQVRSILDGIGRIPTE